MNTTQNNISQQSFVKLPTEILFDSRISSIDKMVYACLVFYDGLDFEPGYSYMAKKINLSRSTFRKSFQILEDLSLVGMTYRSAKDGRNGYKILPPNTYTRIKTGGKNFATPLVKYLPPPWQNFYQRTRLGTRLHKQIEIKLHYPETSFGARVVKNLPTGNMTHTAKENPKPKKLSDQKPKVQKPKPKKQKYEQADLDCAVSWIKDLKSRHSHFKLKPDTTAIAISKLRRLYRFSYAEILEFQKLALYDEFWASNLNSPTALLRRWKNGVLAIDKFMIDKPKLVKEMNNPFSLYNMENDIYPNQKEKNSDLDHEIQDAYKKGNVIDMSNYHNSKEDVPF